MTVSGQGQVIIVSAGFELKQTQVGIRAEKDVFQLVVQRDGDIHRLRSARSAVAGPGIVVNVAAVSASAPDAAVADQHGHVHGLVVAADAHTAAIGLHRVGKRHRLNGFNGGIIAELVIYLFLNQRIEPGIQRIGVRGKGICDRTRRGIAQVVWIIPHHIAAQG